MTDRELLELAARAAGIDGWWEQSYLSFIKRSGGPWNPLTDDGHALQLAVKLQLSMDLFDDQILVGYTPNHNDCDQVLELPGTDRDAATRRAIVRAAAEIGRTM